MSNDLHSENSNDEIEENTAQADNIVNEESENNEVEGLTVEAAQIQALEAELAKANETITGQKDQVIRAKAEVENVRKRAEADVEKARKFALEAFAGELLTVVDNLERASQSADAENEALKPLLEGVDLTHKSFITTLNKFGLEVIDPQGETFNPEHHQAMSMQETVDFPANTVMAVMQKGYLINGRLLRPAMVMVARAPEGGVDTTA